MIRINLLPPEIAEEKAKRRQMEFMVGGVIFIVVMLLIVYVVKTSKLVKIEKEFKTVTAALERESAIVTQVESLKMRKNVLSTRMNIIKKLVEDQFTWVEILDEVNGCLPKDIWLSSLTSSKTGNQGSITFSGIAFDNFAIADFITSLDNSGYFSNVELSYIEKGQEIDKVMTLQFVLTCRIQI